MYAHKSGEWREEGPVLCQFAGSRPCDREEKKYVECLHLANEMRVPLHARQMGTIATALVAKSISSLAELGSWTCGQASALLMPPRSASTLFQRGLQAMTGPVADLSAAVPEPHRGNIKKLAERIYANTAQQNSSSLNLTAPEADEALQDINTAIDQANAALQGAAWTEAYTALVTMRDVVRNFSAALSMRRASSGQYDTVWPGSRWKGGDGS
ncbi:hypothetical protein BDV95DRAFT_597692 [Massariosphaeria phaeospora]|uniref:Uncharacterized protein n=1 Tax=Massariosphaeria phaeospora TaxID=100035 RepID=A0A7C8M3R5_9PLEO|nr:hypothetical protein BDV95DRAFT_597692 [Massariosphaeria phaeospora]